MADDDNVSSCSAVMPDDVEEGCLCKAVAGINVEPFAANQKVIVKFLLTNAAAGIVIGRKGQNRNELQHLSGAGIQLSRNSQFYPGTTERMLLLSGTIRSVLTALYHILIKLGGAEQADFGAPKKLSTQIKVVMPAVVCGSIIGRGGTTIKSFSLDSGSNISVSPQDPERGAEYDRIITIAGGLDQIVRAVGLIVTKVAESPNYVNSTTLALNCPGPPLLPAYPIPQPAPMTSPFFPRLSLPPMPLPAMPPPAGLSPSAVPGSQRSEVTLTIPDARIGAIIGKGGENIIGLKRMLGVRITISDRDESKPGSERRKVRIFGTAESVHLAQMVIMQKVQQADLPLPMRYRRLANGRQCGLGTGGSGRQPIYGAGVAGRIAILRGQEMGAICGMV